MCLSKHFKFGYNFGRFTRRRKYDFLLVWATLILVKISVFDRNGARLLGYPWRGKNIRRTSRTMSRYTYVAYMVGSYCGDTDESSVLVYFVTDW